MARRVPKFLDYFERVLARNPTGKGHMLGKALSYVDLSVFQVIAGLRYAFPKAMTRLEPEYPRLVSLYERLRRARTSRRIWLPSGAFRSTRTAFSGIILNWMLERSSACAAAHPPGRPVVLVL